MIKQSREGLSALRQAGMKSQLCFSGMEQLLLKVSCGIGRTGRSRGIDELKSYGVEVTTKSRRLQK